MNFLFEVGVVESMMEIVNEIENVGGEQCCSWIEGGNKGVQLCFL